MTYADAYARDGGTFEFFLKAAGCRYILGTSVDTPDIALVDGFSYLPGLKAESIRLGCSAALGEVWPDVPLFDARFVDKDETLSAYLKTIESENTIRTELTAQFDVGDAVMTVGDTSQFNATGVIYVDQEAIRYGAKAATEFQNLTAAYMGSNATEHSYDVGVFPPVAAEVTDGPGDLRGHRVTIYAAERVNGIQSATEQIWVGDVGGYIRFDAKTVYIPLRHMITAFKGGKIFGSAPSAQQRGLYVPNWNGNDGSPYGSWGHFSVRDTAGGYIDLSPVTEGTATFYATKEALIAAWRAQIDPVANWEAGVDAMGYAYVKYIGPDFGTLSGSGTLTELLGFDDSVRYDPKGTDEYFTATHLPATFFFPISGAFLTGHRSRVYVGTGQAAAFRETGVMVESEAFGTHSFEVLEVNAVDDYLEIDYPRSVGPMGGLGSESVASVMARGPMAAPLVRQTWDFRSVPLQEVVRVIWQGQTYAGASSFAYTAPMRWMVSPGMLDADVDWTSLKTLCNDAPIAARMVDAVLKEPTEVSKFIMGHLLAAGIYAFVKGNGIVGWAQTRAPALGETGTTVDSTLILAKEAADITTEFGRDKLMNIVNFELTTAVDVEEETKKNVLVVDRLSVQRYGPAMARDASDPANDAGKKATKIPLHTNWQLVGSSFTATADDLAQRMVSTVMFLLGRPRTAARLPVSIKARGIEIGDVVTVTTVWIRNGTTGTLGVTAKVGLCIGWTRPLGATGTDYLEVMLIDEPLGVIAPAALATNYVGGIKRFTFADTNIYHKTADDSDLDFFEVGDKLRGYDYDSAAPVTWTAEVAAIDIAAKTMDVTNDVGVITAPAIVAFDDYSNCTADQTGEGWIWSADDADGQIADLVNGRRWG